MMILVLYHRRFMPTDLLIQILDHVSCNLFEETSIKAVRD